MFDFNKKTLQRKKTLGERLRQVREELGLTLEEVARRASIQERYLRAIEGGAYQELPGPVYIESFLRRYAQVLGVNESFVLEIFKQQEQRVLKKQYHPTFATAKQQLPKTIVTPRQIQLVLIGLVIVACLSYAGFQVAKIFLAPAMTLISPADYSTVTASTMAVRGTTVPEASITINGQPVFLDESGTFSEFVELKTGLNTITVIATKKRSKPTVIQRHIQLDKPPTNQP